MRKGKKKAAFRWGSEWTVLWILGGFVLTYFAFVTHEFMHPLHWLFSILGGVAGYGIGLFVDSGLPTVVRFVRSRRAIMNRGGKRQAKRIN